MKLLAISNMRGVEWAGSETPWWMAALRARELGHEVTAMLHPDLLSSPQVRTLQQRGGRIRQWRALPFSRLQPLKERLWPTFPKAFLEQQDAVLVSLGSLPALAYVPGLIDALVRTRTRLVVLCQFNAGHLAISPAERAAVTAVLGRSAAVVFVSERNRDEARRQFAFLHPDTVVIRNPIREMVDRLEPFPTGGPATFACVARLELAWKGQDVLLEVLSGSRWRERDWELRLYGAGPDRTALLRLVEHFGLSARVSLCGHVRDLREIWGRNQMLVLPSHGEGLPLAAVEAMMFGRPVLATDVGGNREIIAEGVNGFLAAAPTAGALDEAMERAWAARGEWEKMGAAAFRCAKEWAAEDPTARLLGVWTGQVDGSMVIR